MSVPDPAAPWRPQGVEDVAALFAGTPARWWLSGGLALEHWLGRRVRDLPNTDVSTLAADAPTLLGALPPNLSAWALLADAPVALSDLPPDADVAALGVFDQATHAWTLKVNVEDGAPRAWLYRRDPRVQVPWERAVLDVRGVPTGAPELQLLWKALRPRPQDDADRDAVLPALGEAERGWLEQALLRVHPHSTWAIHTRSPFAPARASWNRGRGTR